MSVLWSAADIQTLTFATPQGADDWVCNDLVLDGRQTKPGDLFIAIKGDTHDGHDYLAQAAGAGAVAALVEKPIANAPLPCLFVRNTAKALEQLGSAARRRFQGQMIAVTGSVGKTTTKEMLAQALSASGVTQASRSSYNNWLGVPFTLACLKAETQFNISEIGMNHPFEIMPLTAQVKPDIALITTIAETHIENLGSIEAIAHAKAELFDGLTKDGIVVLPADNAHYEFIQKLADTKHICHIYRFGRATPHTKLIDLQNAPNHLHVKADILGEKIETTLSMGGEHHVTNLLATLLTAKILTGSAATAAAALNGFGAISGRGLRYALENNMTLIDESYNASPTAMAATLKAFGMEPKRRIAVLGDMRELGDKAPFFHEEMAEPIINSGIDALFLCGPNMAYLAKKIGNAVAHVVWQPDSAALAPVLIDYLEAHDTILVKGSLGSKMKIIVEALLKKHKSHAV